MPTADVAAQAPEPHKQQVDHDDQLQNSNLDTTEVVAEQHTLFGNDTPKSFDNDAPCETSATRCTVEVKTLEDANRHMTI